MIKDIEIFSYSFRVFFILASMFAALLIPIWLSLLFSYWEIDTTFPLLFWHSHEMIFGFVAAAIAGFILTAMSTWTGKPPLNGWKLALLALLWLLARFFILFPSYFSNVQVALLDLSFFIFLLLYVSWVIILSKNFRNLVMVLMLCILLFANLIMHLGNIQNDLVLLKRGEVLSINAVVLLMVIVAGRIIPAFTANWLKRVRDTNSFIISNKYIDALSIISIVLVITADLFLGANNIFFLYLAAAFVNGYRLLGWKSWLCINEPLLWVLHLAYAWIVLALFLRGMLPILNVANSNAWVHALGVGGMATMILGVMTRVSLGHTGRQLILPKGAVLIYYLISISALCRLIYGLGYTTNTNLLYISAFTWSLSFILFLFLYFKILLYKRIDL